MSTSDPPLTVLAFSSAYDRQSLFERIPHRRVDLRDVPGTNGYLDDAAREEILRRLKENPFAGIHFLDSGNYHYMSYLWMKRAREPFLLFVLDNHTDMQPPAFGGLLSCGGWVALAMEELPLLKGVVLVGPEEEAFERTDPSLRERVRFFSRESLKAGYGQLRDYIEGMGEGLPVYLSLDKDILCREDALTDWDQGQMTGEELLSILDALFDALSRNGRKLLAFDICGDGRDCEGRDSLVNERMNERILELCRRKREVFEVFYEE